MTKAGRPRTSSPTAIQTRLSRWLDANWDRLGITNEQAAAMFGFRAPNTISMWRTGRSPVPLSRLPKMAELFNMDPMVLVILWFEQEESRDPSFPTGVAAQVRKRVCTRNEQVVLEAVRTATKNADPDWTASAVSSVINALQV